MKLLTEISGNDDDVILVCNGDIGVPGDDQLEHDAMAAHALMRAMTALNGAGWSRLRNPVAEIRERADAIMRQWGFGEGEG